MKSIHITKLWRGAVFALKESHEPGTPTVFYHCDYIDSRRISFTCLHTDKTYTKELYDRYVWLRSGR